MTPMRWFYAGFWLLVGTMLFLQFNNYNKHLEQAGAAAGPRQQHFFYVHGQANAVTSTEPPPKPDGADVKQVAFTYDNNTPSQGYITCHVFLKNNGNMKAVGVQVQVFPYRGIVIGEDNDNNAGESTGPHALDDNDPLAQLNQWVSFPDIAPGQTTSGDAVFMSQRGYKPGNNNNPQIIFQTEKPNPAPAPAH